MENNKINKTNKTNKKLVILCIILTIIIMGLVAFIAFSLGNKKTTLPQQAEQQEEIEFNDSKVIEEISKKIDMLLAYYNPAQEFSLSQLYNEHNFRRDVLKNALTKEEKLQIVLESTTEWEKISGDAWKDYEELVNRYKDVNPKYLEQAIANDQDIKQVSSDKVNKNSISLFGEKADDTIEKISGCPTFLHKHNSTIYISWASCGGTSPDKIASYKSKFTQKNDEVYVYVNFASLSFAGNDTYHVYKDIENYSTNKEENKLEYTVDETFIINENNSHMFSEYKFTFKKDTNDNYYFVGVKQTK